jgi:hypothetical protein
LTQRKASLENLFDSNPLCSSHEISASNVNTISFTIYKHARNPVDSSDEEGKITVEPKYEELKFVIFSSDE